jgi:hypothetical protein
MNKISLFIFASLLIGGCAIKPVHFDGKSATYTHYEGDFAGAMIQAKELCSKTGKTIKHDSTSCTRTLTCVSTFSCTNQ